MVTPVIFRQFNWSENNSCSFGALMLQLLDFEVDTELKLAS